MYHKIKLLTNVIGTVKSHKGLLHPNEGAASPLSRYKGTSVHVWRSDFDPFHPEKWVQRVVVDSVRYQEHCMMSLNLTCLFSTHVGCTGLFVFPVDMEPY